MFDVFFANNTSFLISQLINSITLKVHPNIRSLKKTPKPLIRIKELTRDLKIRLSAGKFNLVWIIIFIDSSISLQ